MLNVSFLYSYYFLCVEIWGKSVALDFWESHVRSNNLGGSRVETTRVCFCQTIMLQPGRPSVSVRSDTSLLGLRTCPDNWPLISLLPFTQKNRHFLTWPSRSAPELHPTCAAAPPPHLAHAPAPPAHPACSVAPMLLQLGRPTLIGYMVSVVASVLE
jgi:hypothetical protein